MLVQQGKHDEAEDLYRDTLERQRRVLGPEHEATLDTASSLVVALQSQHKHAEAGPLVRATLDAQVRYHTLAWCPCLSSSKHHEVCTEKVGLALIKLFGACHAGRAAAGAGGGRPTNARDVPQPKPAALQHGPVCGSPSN